MLLKKKVESSTFSEIYFRLRKINVERNDKMLEQRRVQVKF